MEDRPRKLLDQVPGTIRLKHVIDGLDCQLGLIGLNVVTGLLCQPFLAV